MSILSFLGIVALIGIIVNDSLVLVSKYNINIKSGQGVYDAIYNAGISRFRAIVGDIGGRLIVASPLYKQHFDLVTGECLDNSDISVPVYAVELVADHVLLKQ